MGRIHLITIAGKHAPILPAMLSHYRRLGADDLKVVIHSDDYRAEHIASTQQVALEQGADVEAIAVVPWHMSLNTMIYAQVRARHPDDWFLIADQDELQTYPDGLIDVITHCERQGYDFIEGALVDRVTRTGELSPVTSAISLWDQFPLAGLISGRIVGTCINKIVAAKGRVRLVHGQHFSLSGRGCPVESIYIQVHHFKWVDGLVPSLTARLDHHAQYSDECRRVIDYLRRSGRLDVERSDLMMSECVEDYPHWAKVREWRTWSQVFSPDLTARANATPLAIGWRSSLA
ncbi:MAG TPA: hypothetical protein VG736_11275 [Vicinamibacterales bacterium]|jgi:hypothetical protein|nr:hypothetical protein [Vicinamibacterales bacterium]